MGRNKFSQLDLHFFQLEKMFHFNLLSDGIAIFSPISCYLQEQTPFPVIICYLRYYLVSALFVNSGFRKIKSCGDYVSILLWLFNSCTVSFSLFHIFILDLSS